MDDITSAQHTSPADDTRTGGRARWRHLSVAAAVAGWGAVASVAAVTVTYGAQTEPSPVVVAAYSAPALLVGVAMVAGVAGVMTRRTHLPRAAFALAALWTSVIAVGVINAGGHPTTTSSPVRVVAANLYLKNVDIDGAVSDIDAANGDIVITSETFDHLDRLRDHWDGTLQLAATGQSGGRNVDVAIWVSDNINVTATGRLQTQGWTLPYIDIDTPGGELRILGVHIEAPNTRVGLPIWQRQLDDIATFVGGHDGNLVAAGDFNSGLTTVSIQPLLDHVDDSARVQRRPVVKTWPSAALDWPVGVPVLELDHIVVTDNVAVTSSSDRHLTGSDHRFVIADVGVAD